MAPLKPRSENPSPKRRSPEVRDSGSFPEIDASRLSESAAHSTPNFNHRETRFPDTGPPGSKAEEPVANKVQYSWDRLSKIQGFRASPRPEHNVAADPLAMDDPAFPERWRMPPAHVLENLYRSQELGKMWKYADQIAVFEGSIQQYVRWVPTFYDMVHIQPMPWAYKINVLATKLAPKISSFVIGSLAFGKRDTLLPFVG